MRAYSLSILVMKFTRFLTQTFGKALRSPLPDGFSSLREPGARISFAFPFKS